LELSTWRLTIFQDKLGIKGRTSFLDIPDEASSLFELLGNKETGSLKETFKDSDAIVSLQSLANRDIHSSDYSFNPESSSIEEKYHLFCLVDWYVKHPRDDWYGYSAIVCYNFTLFESDCSFVPIQRILGRCAYGKLKWPFLQDYQRSYLLLYPSH